MLVEPDKIKNHIDLINANSDLNADQTEDILTELAHYECWKPFQKLISKSISNSEGDVKYRHMIWLAKVQYINLDDLPACTKTCKKLVKAFKLNYASFRKEILTQIINIEDWSAEIDILETVSNVFEQKKDKSKCLERLCLIYEKKCPKEDELARTFERLLQVDNENLKALRYFKMIYTQDNEWKEVVKILEKMVKIVENAELHRIAQELASVKLYQLDEAKDALRILDTYCQNSPLDTTNLYYDSYFNIGEWDSCLAMLDKLYEKSTSSQEKSVIEFKRSQIYQYKEDIPNSIKHAEEALKLDPSLLEAFEQLIAISLVEKQWENTIKLLNRLKTEVQSVFLVERIQATIEKLEYSIENG